MVCAHCCSVDISYEEKVKKKRKKAGRGDETDVTQDTKVKNGDESRIQDDKNESPPKSSDNPVSLAHT